MRHSGHLCRTTKGPLAAACGLLVHVGQGLVFMAHMRAGVYINISPLDVGWAKLVEITRYIRAFQDSGKFCWAYLELGGEKEYFLACACGQIFVPPSSAFSLKGFAVQGAPCVAVAVLG